VAANDLHVTLTGPTQIFSFYSGGTFGYPASHHQNPDKTWSVDYSSAYSNVPPGQITHVGWCTDKAVNGMQSGSATMLPPFYWTQDGRQIGRVVPVGHEWGPVVLNDQLFAEVKLTNVSPVPVNITRFDWAVINQPIELDALMWDPLDTTIAWQPLQAEHLLPGGTSEAPGTVRATIPLPVQPTENRYVVFRVLAADAEQPEGVIRGIGQAHLAAAVQPHQ
jgi:hypothetical protein